jgi:hypothetical protein
MLCDYSHRLVDCFLENKQLPLRNLDITICIRGLPIGDEAKANSEGIAHCVALMNPIRRLRTHTASVISFKRTLSGDTETSMLPTSPEEEDLNHKSVQSCRTELTESPIPPQRSPILVRFAQLAGIVSRMSQHPFWREEDVEEMEFVLNNGRSARENDDMKAMMSAFQEVFEMLKKYNADHQEFIKKMNQCFAMMRPNDKCRSG